MKDEVRVETAITHYTFLPGGPFGDTEKTFDIRSYAVVRDRQAVLVDALLPDHEDLIAAALHRGGLDFAAVRAVVVTHAHPDHIGSLAAVMRAAPEARLYAGSGDAEVVAEECGVDVSVLNDGDDVWGLEVIATPGHTIGHVCFLEHTTSTLFVGDAAVNMTSLEPSIEPFDEDHSRAVAQLVRLAGTGAQRALFAHGAPIPSGASVAFRDLAGRLGLATGDMAAI
ncbi:hypothetical protein ONO23_03115 [Micromonospora noduli]|uniref:Metallo-beta-lactamase domain-containing protein n=1 Tax=Micromonospora noduli TaxID=709876 RepID=A0A328N6T4_9ACTN|nr:MBL fold metallo-hydrolase [Micromonospora noduli]KAB1928221.1 MBL fold metallo-hydrolase [Micromonospora noduli]RAO04217.1 hypothetical protein LAH08_01565 [Micromonospora noduli]RAO32697.1 hypothetical protein ONO23_03115 [Micromonospora noduli]RAO53880.1 hypothetical protein ONO86_01386 [Micromonospora noduli]